MKNQLLRNIPLLILTLFLLLVNFIYGIETGQTNKVDGAVYRWRQAVLVSLSRSASPPATRYEIHGSLLSYFIANGMAITSEEVAGPMPAIPEWSRVLADSHRLEQLLANTSKVIIDNNLPPDVIRGNEIGYADFYWLSFKIFGTHISSTYYFYFLLITISVISYAYAQRKSPLNLLVLCLYLTVHLYAMDYCGRLSHFNVIQNCRGFSALAILPGLHLLISLFKVRLNIEFFEKIAIGYQIFLLGFLLHCRLETIWVPMAVSLILIFIIKQSRFMVFDSKSYCTKIGIGKVLFIVVFLVLILPKIVLPKSYVGENGRHPFWHVIYSSVISPNPTLRSIYLIEGEEPYSDTMGYLAVRRELRKNNDASSRIAFVQDGQIHINIMNGVAEYDRLLRPIVLRIILEHPIEALKSFVYKAEEQILFFRNVGVFDSTHYIYPIFLALLSYLTYFTRLRSSNRVHNANERRRTFKAILLLVCFSLITPMLEPSVLAIGTLSAFLLLIFTLPILANTVRKKF